MVKRLNLVIDKGLYDELKRVKGVTGLTVTAIIKKALAFYFKHKGWSDYED